MTDTAQKNPASVCHLWVIRHGQANAPSGTQRDADRTLTPFGHSQAAHIAERISGSAHRPSMVLVSPAQRAQQTAAPIVEALGLDAITNPTLMTEALVSDVIDLVVGLSAQNGRADDAGTGCIGCIIGHNPTLEDLVAVLVEGVAARPNPMHTGEASLIRFDPHAVVGSGVLIERHRLT